METTIKQFTVVINAPVNASSELGGAASNKGYSKADREIRYFLNALVRRGGRISSVPVPEGWATVGGTEEPKAAVAEQPKPKAHAKS